jgi:outer membrane autotransporter protein
MANGMIVTPRLSAAWQHGFGDLTPAASLAFAGTTNADFTVTGVPLARDSAVIDAGLDVTISPQARLGVSYFGQLAGSSSTNAVRGHFTWTF